MTRVGKAWVRLREGVVYSRRGCLGQDKEIARFHKTGLYVLLSIEQTTTILDF